MSNSFGFVLGTSAVLSLVIGTSAVQAAETFSVDNVALNTNWNFRRIDGNPRMSIYQRNDNDPDQQFDRLPGNRGGTLLKHRSTGRCLNAHYLSNGSEINVWPCDSNDPDQNWNLDSVSDGRILIKRTGTNLCVDTPTRDNAGKVHLWTCDGNNPNQRWLSSAGQPGSIDMQGLQRLLFGNVASTVTSPYGYQRCDIWQGIYAECKHPALDIAGPVNTSIYSPIEGTVIRRSDDIGAIGIYNQKSNITFFFAHMNRTDVSVGNTVTKGQQVGIEGTKGYITGPHLHFEARPGNQYYMATNINQTIDPLAAVNQANR
ncbi:MAG TPA: peptidoglycan DD-metalloendopeptidase family protein [Stenomitos sp.]